MRQIKFRAWDKLTNQMVGDGFHLFGEFMMFRLLETYIIENPVEHRQNSGLEYELWRYENIEIMQFTGLLDKNGKEIYEGDIVKTQPYRDRPISKKAKTKQHIGVVEYRTGAYCAEFTVNIADEQGFGCCSWSPFYNCEVIGNIHEHPNLLTTNTQDKCANSLSPSMT